MGKLPKGGLIRTISAKGFKKKKNMNNGVDKPNINKMHHSSSIPDNPNSTTQRHGHHAHANTMTNLYYVPSKIRHQANPNKASKILGINSDAVILANHNRKKRKPRIQNNGHGAGHRHRKSNSFSDKLSLKNLKNTISGNNTKSKTSITPSPSPKPRMNVTKHVEVKDNDNEEEESFAEEDDDYYDDDEMDSDELDEVKIKFDKFRPQKRNTGSRRELARSQTVDWTNKKLNIYDDDSKSMKRKVVINENNNTIQKSQTMHTQIPSTSMPSGRRRSRLSISGKSGGDSSDVIEITFRIDKTKKGYIFIGLLPANKINNVVQPGFMFGFNEYSYGFHGYSGKLYHDKIQSDYYHNANNGNNKRKNSNNTSSHSMRERPGHIPRSQTVDLTTGISGSGSTLISHTSTATNTGISGLGSLAGLNLVDESKDDDFMLNSNNSNDNDALIGNNSNNNNNNKKDGNNKKCPVLKSGDIVTIKMKLNRNNNKFAVIFNINNIDYGIAWKTIDPPVTIGITMVGRNEQISLLSCNYKPYKNDKSCVIL